MLFRKKTNAEVLREILQEVRRIELTTKKNVNAVFSGFYNSAFRGSGMQFADTRPYVAGDDVRHIAWSLSARSQSTHVKRFEEERELHVVLAVDVSRSRIFGGERAAVGRRLIQVAANLGFAAAQNHDLVGALFFTNKVEKRIPVKKGQGHCLRIIRDLVAFEPSNAGTNLEPLFLHIENNIRHRAVIFVISDFIAALPKPRALRVCASKHEIVCVSVIDPFETYLPSGGLVSVEDAESGVTRVIDVGLPGTRQSLEKKVSDYRERVEKHYRQNGCDFVELSVPEKDTLNLTRFFMERRGRGGLRSAVHAK